MNNLQQFGLPLAGGSVRFVSFPDGTSNTILFGQTGSSSPGNGHGQGNAFGHSNSHNPHSHEALAPF
jgi:hypothetical protein